MTLIVNGKLWLVSLWAPRGRGPGCLAPPAPMIPTPLLQALSSGPQVAKWTGSSVFVGTSASCLRFSGGAALCAAATKTLDVPATRLCLGDRAFAVAGARHWNLLPKELRLITDIATFKSQLKTHLFRIAFDLS